MFDYRNLSESDLIQILGIVASLLISIISIIIAILTLRQNSKMIEESSRPYITIYGQKVDFGNLKYFLIVKNFGASSAIITEFIPDVDLNNFAPVYSQNPFKHIVGTKLAPQQTITCNLDIDKLLNANIDKLSFKIAYKSHRRYKDNVVVNFVAETENAITRIHQKNENELKIISSALQGIGERML